MKAGKHLKQKEVRQRSICLQEQCFDHQHLIASFVGCCYHTDLTQGLQLMLHFVHSNHGSCKSEGNLSVRKWWSSTFSVNVIYSRDLDVQEGKAGVASAQKPRQTSVAQVQLLHSRNTLTKSGKEKKKRNLKLQHTIRHIHSDSTPLFSSFFFFLNQLPFFFSSIFSPNSLCNTLFPH